MVVEADFKALAEEYDSVDECLSSCELPDGETCIELCFIIVEDDYEEEGEEM